MIVINKTSNRDAALNTESLKGVTFNRENKGHKFVISCMRGGVLEPISGTVTGYFIRSNNTTCRIEGTGFTGVDADGRAWIILPQDCYNVAGRFKLSIYVSHDGTSECIYSCIGTVERSDVGEVIDSGVPLPSYDDIADMYQEMETARQACIDAAESVDGAVRYDADQSLTSAQKTQARTNIGAASAEDVDDLKSAIDDYAQLVGGESENLHDYADDAVGEYYNSSGEITVEPGTTKYWLRTPLIDISAYDSVVFSGGKATLNQYNAFFDENESPVEVLRTAASGTLTVPDGAKYVGFSIEKGRTYFRLYGLLRGTINKRIDGLEPVVNTLDYIGTNGYGNLLDESWARGGWISGSFSTNVKYRAGINVKTTTNTDLELLAKRGFQLLGAAEINGETVSSTGSYNCWFYVPAGAEYTLTVRRITENTSEQLTDEQVQEFASAVMVTNVRGSDYMRYRHTFTGFEMFESMAIIGDSYSAGNNGNNWGKCLGRMIGTTVNVWATSGDRTYNWITHYMDTMLSADPQGLYWLNLGINDANDVKNTPSYLGTSADVDETTYPDVNTFPNTFWGNYGRIIRNIQIHAPNAKLVLEKTLFGNSRNAQTNIDSAVTLTINNTIGEIAEHYGIPCIDQMDDAFYLSREYAQSMSSNHPRAYVWPGMANANRRLFAKCVLDNPQYFY